VGAQPFLTAAVQPAAELGRQAIRLLLERLAHPDGDPRDIILPTQLIVRQSCGCASAALPSAAGG
jgi:LacI family transcriptional regulator